MINQPLSIHGDAAMHAKLRMKRRMERRSKRRLVKSILMRRQRGWRLLVKLALSGAAATAAGIVVIFGQAANL